MTYALTFPALPICPVRVCIFYFLRMLKTRRRKALAAVLGIAMAVFMADRVMGWFPGPEQAAASVPLGVSLGQEFSEEMRATAALTNIPPAPRTLAARLHELAGADGLDAASVTDAFCPSEAWIAKPRPKEPTAATAQPDLAGLRVRQFAERHKLTATAVGPDGGMAIIDGQCLVVGHQMDGLKLVAVDRSSATLEADGIKVKLSLAKDSPK